jgi:hypothetical protein
MPIMQVICSLDPALDLTRGTIEEMRESIETRDIARVQKFIAPARRPAVFHLREIPNLVFMRYVQGAPIEEERFLRAFTSAVVRVDNLPQGDGTLLPSWEPALDQDGVMKLESLERFRPYQITEVGGVAYTHSFLAQGTNATFVQSRTLLRALAQMEFRPAESSPSSRESDSANPSSDSEGKPSSQAVTVIGSAT